MTALFWSTVAQTGATGALDSMISGLNISAPQLAIFTLVFAVVVILLVLGVEFWFNLYGLLTAPSVASSRIMGEQQILPALFVVLMSGLITAIFSLMIMTTPQYIESQSDQIGQALSGITEMYASMGVPYVSTAFNFKIDDPDLTVMKALGFFLMVPLTFTLFWYAWGVGVLIAGKLIGMRNAAGVNNAVCGLAYPILLSPFMYWSSAQAQIFGHSAAWGLYGVLALIQLLWLLNIMREFFRVGWVPTIIGLLLSLVAGGVVFAIAFTLLAMFYGILKEQLPQYV
ncbi:MAG: hypothetical protein GEEBNDBF_01000 [bacterium]|nr:hypothetical protein [bacterium]